MFTQKFIYSISAGALALAGFATHAEDLNLACARETRSGLDVKTVLIGDDSAAHALQRSSNDATPLRLKNYAVVITIVTHGSDPSTEEWEVLDSKQFKLTEQTGNADEERSWNFLIKKSRKSYICSSNHQVHANPALTRNN